MVGNIADLSVRTRGIPQADTSWLSSIANTLGGAIDQASQNKSFNSLAERIGGTTPVGQPQQSGGFLSSLFRPQESQTVARTAQPSAATPPQGQPPIAGIQATSQTQPSPSAPRTASQTAGVPEQVGQKSPMEVASTLLGKGEVPDRSVIQEYLKNGGVNLDPATTAWCAAYVNSSLAQSGYKGTGSNLARSFLNYGEAVDQPQRGDIAVFSRTNNPNLGHVGFYDSVNPDGSIRILAGNQGDAVSYGNMPSDRLLGYRRPVAGSNGGSVDAVNAMVSGQPMPTNQVADASGNIMAPAVTPIQRGGVDPSLIQFMLRDPNLRQTGLQLWQQNATGKTSEPWQFVTLPDGTLARANQQTGAIERVGNYAKPVTPEEKNLVNAGEGRLYDPNTGKWIVAPSTGETGFRRATPEEAAQYGSQAGQFGPDGRFYPNNPPNGTQLSVGPDGQVTMTQGPIGKAVKLTETEGKNAGFLVRANDSQKILNNLEEEGTSLWNNTAGKIPIAGNFMRSQDAQKYDQAKRDFINAQLRRESGAVISPEEFANAEQQYFPQPGDGPEVIAQKRRNRDNAIRGLEIGSGPGVDAAKQPRGTRQPIQIDGYTIQEVD